MARHHRGRGRRGGRQANPRGSGGSGRDEANWSGAEAGNHNGHNYDDHSSVGQSQPADQSQAAPPLAEEPAALLRKESFEAIGIHVRRAEPVFPPGPGYGVAGTPCVGRANRFLGRPVDEGLHQYNVTISPQPTTKGAYREVMTKLVSENQHTELGGRFPAYDGRDSLFTAGALPFGTKEFEVTLSAGGDKRMDRKYKVVINHATAISMLQLRMLLAGYPTDIPAQVLQVLETVLGDVLFNERNDIERVPIGTNDHTLGVEAWKGLYQSIRSTQDGLSLIADVCSSIFVQPLLLIDFVQKILKIDVDRNLTEHEYDKALWVVKIEVTHRGNKHHKYRIAGLSVKPTNDLSSESPSGATKTVIDHFRERYSLELKYKSLPCIDVGSEQKPIYLPIEVCKIVPRQCYQKNLECSQVSTLRKSASIQPEPEQSSHQVVDRKHTKCANEFGIEFDDNLTTVDARVLLPPNLKYHDSGSQKTWFPMNGHWNMKDKKVINGAKISNWACVNFCEDLSKKAIEEFCFKLAEMSRIIGAGIYGYPIEIQALFFMAMRCALSWLDFGTINDIYGYKTEEYSQTALNKFNVIPESVSDCIFDFMPIHGGYLIGNVDPAMDFRWFCLGIFIATLSSLATGEQAKAILDVVEECWQRFIGEMPLKICYPAMENQIITECGPKNTRWSYDNEGSWPDAAREALKRSIVYLRGQSIGTVAAIDKSQGAELSDAQLVPHGFSPKQLMDIVRKMSVSNKVTVCLDKSEDGSNDMCLKSFQAGIGATRLWCLKYGLHYDFSHIYGATVFSFTTPPGGTFYITLKFEGRSITLLLAGRDLYIKGWRDESHGSFEIRMEHCSAYMLGKVKVMNIEKNYSFLSTSGKVGGTRIGPDALREAFNILFKYKGERSSEVKRAIGVFAVNFPEAIRIQKVYKTVVRSFLNSDQQVLDPIPIAPDEPTPDPEDTNTLWIENYGHYSHQAILDANARDSGTDPPGIGNRDGAHVESATEIFREIRVGLRDACPEGENETEPQKIEDPDDKINQSFIPKPKPITRKKRRRKGKVPDLEGGDGESAESVALFLLEDWLPEEDEIDDDETRKQKGSDLEGGDGESGDDEIGDDEIGTGKKRRNGKGSNSEGGDRQSEEEIADDKQASKAKEVEWVNFSVGKFLERRMEERIRTMRISEWMSNKLQKTENFHQISQFNAEKATAKKFIPPKPHSMLQRNTVSLGQRLMHRVSRCLRFL